MFRVTRYCVQPFFRQGGKLSAGETSQYYERREAIVAAAMMQRRVAGASVYEVAGWPMQDLWGAPRLIASYGDVVEL